VTLKATIGIFDPHVAFEQSADFERAEINGPDPIVNLFQTDMLADAGYRDVDPVSVPANATVGADWTKLLLICLDRTEILHNKSLQPTRFMCG
jgi:hypothetical protein